MKEIWKDIKGYEELYQISNLGRVKSLERKHITKNRWGEFERTVKEKIRSVSNNLMYARIDLYKDKKCNVYQIHRMVYETFVGMIPEGYIIHHINKNKLDNNINNLEAMDFTTHNNIHSHSAWNKGREWDVKTIKKAQSSRLKHYMPMFIETIRLYNLGLSVIGIAKELNICSRQVYTRLKRCKELGIE